MGWCCPGACTGEDTTDEVLSIDVGLQRRVTQQERQPYIFTEAEIKRLLDAARDSFRHTRHRCDPTVLHAMITLAYCAGLRLGEIVSLTLGDLDVEGGQLEIRDTKFFKSRRLPLATGVLERTAQLLLTARRGGCAERAGGPDVVDAAATAGVQLRRNQKLSIRVLRGAGLKPEHGERGPRVHDLRHTFVGHRMMQWYRDGVEPPPTATPVDIPRPQGHRLNAWCTSTSRRSLLQQASERYRRRCAGALRGIGGPVMTKDRLAYWLHAFFHEWLAEQRNCSRHTVLSYRDTWRMFLRFVAERSPSVGERVCRSPTSPPTRCSPS